MRVTKADAQAFLERVVSGETTQDDEAIVKALWQTYDNCTCHGYLVNVGGHFLPVSINTVGILGSALCRIMKCFAITQAFDEAYDALENAAKKRGLDD